LNTQNAEELLMRREDTLQRREHKMLRREKEEGRCDD